jgi:hypothetical protein
MCFDREGVGVYYVIFKTKFKFYKTILENRYTYWQNGVFIFVKNMFCDHIDRRFSELGDWYL